MDQYCVTIMNREIIIIIKKIMIDRRHEKKKSDGSNTLRIKKRESEEVEPNNQFLNSDRFNSNHS